MTRAPGVAGHEHDGATGQFRVLGGGDSGEPVHSDGAFLKFD
ncbi:hypothetical protein STRAU_2685 [Streptomyces aurantiacus JA 4570]|uniref:Uncharacterized protein n=1 Tax=Streptomyces aurantiacus JA 4570 TaxID=1286094 RepID=S4A0K4_9ACTN|nr:hypothetical protein STRAU_2685 [Streptomyces aurantiacus JA 4570]